MSRSNSRPMRNPLLMLKRPKERRPSSQLSCDVAGNAIRTRSVRVVQQPLPADRCSRLLEVGAHDDTQIRPSTFLDAVLQKIRVLDRLLGVMDRTRSNDDQQTVILSVYDFCGGLTSEVDGLAGSFRRGQVMTQQTRRHQWLVARDSGVVHEVFSRHIVDGNGHVV